MSTGIGWTDETWNPVVGCTRVSPGCKNCYASALHNRRYRDNVKFATDSGDFPVMTEALPILRDAVNIGGAKPPWPTQYDEPFAKVRCLPERLDIPLRRWKTTPKRIFVNSMSDLFHEDVPFPFIVDVMATIEAAPQHTFQVLTKRPERMRECLADMAPLPNLWLGVSVENQVAAAQRIPLLLQTPAAVRFISCEPLLGLVHIDWFDITLIDWVIVGGESGKGHREMPAKAFGALVGRLMFHGVPIFVKQDSGARSGQQGRIPDDIWALKEFPEVNTA